MAPNWSWKWIFVVVFIFRYARLWINLIAYYSHSPIQPADEPTLTSQDVTIIIPTVAEDMDQLKETVETAYRQEPCELILVTPDSKLKRLYQMVEELGYSSKRISVLSVSQANKRRQLSRAIPEVRTRITLLLDDDVWLPEKFCKWALAPFEDPQVGGVGTNQVLRRKDRSNIWEFLGAIYLQRRNFDCTACNYMDGGLPCLSGRAVAYRSEILQDPNFTHGFTHERWGGDRFLNTDDDNFITRWLFSRGWKIQFQHHRECEVETTLETDSKYLKQCLRWVRSNWRSNLTSLSEPHMWRNYPWSLYAVFQTTITQWAFPIDCVLFACCYLALSEVDCVHWPHTLLWAVFIGHCIFSKTIKLMPHLLRNPGDVRFVPLSVLFGYFHNLIKLYGCITVTETTWGTREGADTDDNLRLIPIPPMAIITPPLTPPPREGRPMLRERGAIWFPNAVG
ncbi:polysaccharide synthase Cps1p [Clohesyomyces aquaticus]|uniref:Polysaccharide synthase Cps1p n=1 Tax=Clohesyomyces aquaticus TaxID=1231657 RepID=A0A1Y1ZV59_9PLEO|nr:polysaccharide synthase Cps1p [Clohesyomyces aquaticus]